MNKMESYKVMIYLFLLLSLYTCTGTQGNGVYDNDNTDSTQNNKALSVIGWNVQNYPKHSQTNSDLKDIINQLDVDIIALQEIENNQAFNSLIESLDGNWVGYRADLNSNYQELAYAINTDEINIISLYNILEQDEYYFAYRPPYVLEFIFNDESYVMINNHYKCCDINESDFERRVMASELLNQYVDEFLDTQNVIIIGDLNDSLDDSDDSNAFLPFINDSANYIITDYNIAVGVDDYWSFPSYPSHIDHIIITTELSDIFNNGESFVETLLIDIDFYNSWSEYDQFISDHRPMRLVLQP